MKRRSLITAALGMGVAGLVGCGRGDGPAASQKLRMAWWGNETRGQLTREVITAYQSANPGVEFEGEPAEWASYWDRLATQTAAGDAPDLIQMDLKYLREYGANGALADLSSLGVRTDGFLPGTLEPGRTAEGLVGINAGANALLVAANPAVFEKAGVELPDDQSWTWDDLADTSAKIAAALPGVYGCSDFTLYDLGFWMWVRQRGNELYTEDGLGFDESDAQSFFEYSAALEKAKAIPPVGQAAEDIVAPLSDRLFVKGQTAMSVYWSNQVQSLEKASQAELTLLRFPSMAGTVAESKLFTNVSMMWSIPSRGADTEQAARFVNYLVNDPGAAAILTAERGLPANAAVRESLIPALNPSDQKAARYLELIEPVLTPPGVAPPAGLGDISLPQTRYVQELRFGRTDAATAAGEYVAELRGLISG